MSRQGSGSGWWLCVATGGVEQDESQSNVQQKLPIDAEHAWLIGAPRN